MDKIDLAIKALQKKFGTNYIGFGSEILDKEHIRHSSGIFALDFNNGGGLLVNKKVITIAGDESSGKTMTALIAIATMQKQNKICAWLDVEHSFDAMWATKLGVDVTKLIIGQPKSIEEATDTIETLLMSGSFDLIVLDSLASAPSDKELEDSAEQKSMGGIAKPVGLMMKKITARLNDVKNPVTTCVLLINQIREKVGITFGNPNYMPCGRAVRFHSDIIIWLRPDNQPVGGKEDPVGINVNFIFKKNRTYPPFKTGTYHLLFWKGKADNNKGILEAGVETGVIKKEGYRYTYQDKSASDDKTIIELLSGLGYFTKTQLKECHPRSEEIIDFLVKENFVKVIGSRYKLIFSIEKRIDDQPALIFEKLDAWNTESYKVNFEKLVAFFYKIKRSDWENIVKEIAAIKHKEISSMMAVNDEDTYEEEVSNEIDLSGLD